MIEIIIIVTVLVFSAFFSGFENAIVGLTPLNLIRGDRKKLFNLYLIKDKIVATCLIGNNITIIAGALALDSLTKEFTSEYNRILAFIVQTAIFFIFAEIFPKALFRRINALILTRLYYVVKAFYFVFYPLAIFFITLSKTLFRILPDTGIKKEDIFYFVGSNIIEETPISEALLKLEGTSAREIMTPIKDIYMLDAEDSIKEVIDILEETSYMRYPLYSQSRDNIVGYIRVDDFLDKAPSAKLDHYKYPPTFIPESLSVNKILAKMKLEKLPMVFVVSEHGIIIGQITLEDIAEELVGEIVVKEQKKETHDIIKLGKRRFLLEGTLDLDDFNDYFDKELAKDNFSTINGYLINHEGDFPQKDDEIKTDLGKFKIEEADDKGVHKVIYTPK